jgi:hypothetical protein
MASLSSEESVERDRDGRFVRLAEFRAPLTRTDCPPASNPLFAVDDLRFVGLVERRPLASSSPIRNPPVFEPLDAPDARFLGLADSSSNSRSFITARAFIEDIDVRFLGLTDRRAVADSLVVK